MARELKVFGANLDGKYRGITATTTKAEALKVFGFSKNMASELGETSNPIELETAKAEPGVLFVTKNYIKEFRRVEPGTHHRNVFG